MPALAYVAALIFLVTMGAGLVLHLLLIPLFAVPPLLTITSSRGSSWQP